MVSFFLKVFYANVSQWHVQTSRDAFLVLLNLVCNTKGFKKNPNLLFFGSNTMAFQRKFLKSRFHQMTLLKRPENDEQKTREIFTLI